MEKDRIFSGGFKAMTFLCDHMQQRRPFQVLHHLQVFAEQADVMAIDRAEIAHPELLEQHPAMQACFDAFLELREKALDGITQEGHALQNADDLVLEPRIKLARS